MTNKLRDIDMEDLANHTAQVLKRKLPSPDKADVERLSPMIIDLINANDGKLSDIDFNKLRKLYKFNGKKSFLFQVYLEMIKNGHNFDVRDEERLREHLQIKPCKSWSGIVTITVFTAAFPEYINSQGEKIIQPFSCEFSCSYCPNQPNQPRSYIDSEPGVLRANRNNFDAANQIWDRMYALYLTGHIPSKVEIIVSGGTWSSYPKEYRLQFCRDLYYAVNVFWQDDKRTERLSIQEEKNINQSARSRVIGITIETRPDTISPNEIKLFRLYGVTRVQLGIQHIDDDILRKVNRRCTTRKAIFSIEMLKSNGFKIDAHWMPNLPGSTVEKDRHMLLDVLLGVKQPIQCETRNDGQEHWELYDLECPELSVDYWKLYPTAVTPWTDIEKWYKEGTYVQYPEKDMFEMFLDLHKKIFPFIRINRIIRDIPESHIYNQGTGSDNTNMRDELNTIMKQQGIYSMDIRNREVKNRRWDGFYIIVIRHFKASNGTEYFISAESRDKKILYGFLRLRLDSDTKFKVFPELHGCALIRELRSYGSLSPVGNNGTHVQHKGIGKTLISKAEMIAISNSFDKIAVIAGEGTKPY
ncbi:radical SAM protein, partial [bacterium]|nr:radical SAM protein [Candidatus Elulimicrobium humile]